MGKSGNCGFGVYPLDEKTTKDLDKMIRRIAYSKKNTYMMDPEDMVGELWIKVLEVVDSKKEVDYGFLSVVCFRKIVDLIRQSIKSECMPIDDSLFGRCIPSEQREAISADSSEFTTYDYCSIQRQKSVEEDLEVKEILELFDEVNESKERKLVETWMEILGIKEVEDNQKLPEKAYDRYIAVDILGYASSSSCGYARLRLKVREKLINSGYKLK